MATRTYEIQTTDNTSNNKVGAIKAIRAITGLGLREAKAIVDEAFDNCYTKQITAELGCEGDFNHETRLHGLLGEIGSLRSLGWTVTRIDEEVTSPTLSNEALVRELVTRLLAVNDFERARNILNAWVQY